MPGPPQREYMTRYAREIEREILEGGDVPPPASSFGQNGCIGTWQVGREIGKGASGESLLFSFFSYHAFLLFPCYITVRDTIANNRPSEDRQKRRYKYLRSHESN